MRASIRYAVNGYKLLFALAVGVFLLAVCSGAVVQLGEIHLPGKIASDAEVGLAVSAPDTLYAVYWVEGNHDRLWRLLIYKFNGTTGKVLAQSELGEAEPLRSRNGDFIQSSVELSISPNGSMLLCTTLERGPVRKAWTLSSHDLHVISSRTTSPDTNLLGFAQTGDVRLLRIQKGGKFGQEINSATVIDLNARSLGKNVFERTVRFQEPAWRLIAVGTDDLLWTLDERASSQGDARITAYNLQNGKPIATHDVSLTKAQVGAPAAGHHPTGNDLQPATTIPPPGTPHDAPQLAQIMAASQAVFGVIHQPATQPTAWSRVMRVGVSSTQADMSSVLTGCDLGLEMVGRSGRIAVGSCDLVGRVLFDQYAIKKSDAVFLSTETGSVVAAVPLNTRRPPLSLAIDDSVRPVMAAVYDEHATVRLLSVSQPADSGAARVDPKNGNLHIAVPVPVSVKTKH